MHDRELQHDPDDCDGSYDPVDRERYVELVGTALFAREERATEGVDRKRAPTGRKNDHATSTCRATSPGTSAIRLRECKLVTQMNERAWNSRVR